LLLYLPQAFLLILPQFFPQIYDLFIQRDFTGPEYVWFAIKFHFCLTLLGNCSFFVLYYIKHPFFEKYKISPEPWPWEVDSQWKVMMYKSIALTLTNQLIITPVLLLGDYFYGCDFRTDKESLPSYFEMITQIFLMMLGEDFLFYWAHRFLHLDFIYPHIHYVHHSYIYTVSLATEYAHPLEWIIGNVLPSNWIALIMGKRIHLFTYLMWITMIVTESIDAHSGYEFSFSPYRILPFAGSSDFHFYHHVSRGGNFGSWFTFWDRICGTVSNQFKKYSHNKIVNLDNVNQENKQKSN